MRLHPKAEDRSYRDREELEREVKGLRKLCIYLVSVMNNQLNMGLDDAPMEGTERAEEFVDSFLGREEIRERYMLRQK